MEDPELSTRDATIKTFLPSADAARIESLITEKIEDRLTEIKEIKYYSSTSSSGSSIIAITLEDRVEQPEVDGIWSRVQNKLDEVKSELPPDASEPKLDKVQARAYALITALIWQQDDPPNYAILNRQAKVLKDRLRGITGTEEVNVYGDRQEEILVEMNPEAIASYNLTIEDISRQIKQSDSKVSAGLLRNQSNDLSLEVMGELDTLERVRNIPLNFGTQGQFTRLQDVATVTKGVSSPANDLAMISDRPGVALGVFVESSTRLDLWTEKANKILAESRAGLPRGIELKTIQLQNNYVEDKLNSLIVNLFLGSGLVFLVTLIMMGWRSAVVVGTSLPLSVLMVFGWMKAIGVPLHQMSITGLIVALGILIDNAIIMVDEVTSHLNNGVKPLNSIKNSINHLAIPLSSSTVTTVLAFLPIALLPGATGEFVGTIGLSVILAVSSSLFLSLAVMPTLTAKLFTFFRVSSSKSWWETGISIPIMREWYGKTVTWTTARPLLGICLALVMPVMGFIQAGSLPQQFFPAADRDRLQIRLELPATTAISQTQLITQQVRDRLLEFDDIKDVHWFIGRSVPRFYYNVVGIREQESSYAEAMVELDAIGTSELAKKLQAELDRSFPTARILVRQLEQGPYFDAPIEMRIYGSDLEALQQLGEEARRLLLKVADITHTRANLAEVTPQLAVEVNEEEVRLAGLERRTIARQLESNLEGSLGGSILESTEELPVRVRLSAASRAKLNDITSLNLLSGQNDNSSDEIRGVPLSSLGKVKLIPELSNINRYNGQRVNTVQGFLTPGVLPAEALADFKQQLVDGNWQLPDGYSYEFGGEAEQQDNAISGLVSTVGVIAILMVATLVLSLGSFRLAAVIGVVAIAFFSTCNCPYLVK